MTENPASMHEDGVFLRPTVWMTPETYREQDAREGLLPCMKGATPIELPTLGDQQL